MKHLKSIYEDYLKSIDKFDEDIRLGRKVKTRKKADKDIAAVIEGKSQLLTQRLNERFKFNNRIVILAVVLLCLIFGIGVFLIFYYRDSPATMGGVFGGTFLSLLSIIRWLHKLWQEKSVMDMSLSVLEGLAPKQAAEFISTIYWKLRSQS